MKGPMIEYCAVCNCLIEPDDIPANYCFFQTCERCLPYALESLTEDAKNEAYVMARKWQLDSALRAHKRFVKMGRTESPAKADRILGPGGAQSGGQE